MNGVPIVRRWSAVATPAHAPAYLRFFREHVRPALTAIPGFIDAMVLTREVGSADGAQTEIVVLSRWRTLEAVRAFAGEDLERAVVEPAARALLLACDDRVAHYEVADASGADPTAVDRLRTP